MTKPNPFLWPQKARLVFYNGRGKELWRSSDRRLDLADELMLWWKRPSRTVYMGISTSADSWTRWSEENLSRIEQRIRYDLNFDGYYVTIKRLGTAGNVLCSKEFIWKLTIRTP